MYVRIVENKVGREEKEKYKICINFFFSEDCTVLSCTRYCPISHGIKDFLHFICGAVHGHPQLTTPNVSRRR